MRSKQSSARVRSTSASPPAHGQHPAVGGGHHGGAAEEAGHRVAELGERTAGEHDPHEHAVHLVLALEQRRLLLDDLLERPHPGGRVAREARRGRRLEPRPRSRRAMARSVRPRGDRWQQ